MNQQPNLPEGNFIHQVYFWLANPDNQKEREELLEGLNKLTTVPKLLHYHIGTPATTRREVIDSSYSFSWLAIFATPEDQDNYQEHPIHLEFVASCSHLWKRVIVYDSLDAASQ